MVSMLQQKHQQKFQFLNSFNQTYTRLEKPAQGEFDRLAPYALSSQKRSFLGGSVTTVTQPLSQVFRKGSQKCSLGISLGSITANGGITAIDVLSGGFGYAPNLEYNIIIKGGEPAAGALTQCIATATADGNGRIVSVDIKSTGNNYQSGTTNDDGLTGLTAIVDEGMAIGQFAVGFFSKENTAGKGSITGVEASAGNTGHRPGVYYVEAGAIDGAVAGDGVGGIFQVYVDALGNVNKVLPIGFGKDYVVDDTMTILASQMHNVEMTAPLTDLVLKITAVTDADQILHDYGTVTWRSETFTVGDTILLEYYLDTKREKRASDGLMKTLARDMVLHPYGNYFSSAFSSQAQRTAKIVFTAAPSTINVSSTPAWTGTFTLVDEDMKTLIEGRAPVTVTAISSAAAGVVTAAGHGFSTGDSIKFVGVVGMTEVNGNAYTITSIDTDTFSIVDTTGFTAYVSGGTVEKSLIGTTTKLGGIKAADAAALKRIIEPHGNGVITITGVDVDSGAVSYSYDSTTYTTNQVNPFDDEASNTVDGVVSYASGEWAMAIPESEFESQPYSMIYPYVNEDAVVPITIKSNGQQNHRDVKKCIDRIGDLCVVESEKATDLLSSKNDINSATEALPTSVSLTQPVKDVRKPQKWRMRFFYDQRDEYLYVNVATALQIKDNGDLTKGQGRDGIKQAVYRQPGELSEIYFNFSNDTNKAKSGFFRRQGKTTDDIESGYPLAYRLTCSDHGTGLFMFDQASIDQDDDYAWFVVQRHVHNVSGRIEFEDGRSPVHCLYSPSTRPEETSDFNVGFYASVSEDLNTATGETTITSTSLDELQIFDVNGRKLTPGLPVSSSVITDSAPIQQKNDAYGSGATYAGQQPAGKNIALTDATSLGTDSITGYTITNDFSEMPALTTAYNDLGESKAVFSDLSIISRTEFSQGYAGGSGSSYVPIAQWVTALQSSIAHPTRYGDADNLAGNIAGIGTDDGTGGTHTRGTGPTVFGGLRNYNAARNQMQGPAKLGLTISRVRHRSANGVDTFLDADMDVRILDKTEVAPTPDANGKARELPIVSNVATFNPQSAAALALQSNRRVRIIHYTPIVATYTGDGANSDMVPVYTAGAKADFKTQAGLGTGTIVPIPNSLRGGSTNGYKIDLAGGAESTPALNGFTPVGSPVGTGTHIITEPGSGIFDMVAGDELTAYNSTYADSAAFLTALAGTASGTPLAIEGIRVTNVIDTFPEEDQFIFEYAWEGAGFNNEYTNFFGRSGTASQPLYEVNRLKIFVDGAEADAAVNGQNYTIDRNGQAQFGTTNQSLEYFGVEKPMYAYSLTTDTFKFNQPIERGTVVKLSYENYNDVEERDTGKSTYLIKVPEDRDIPNIWNDIHKVAKGIYRFVVRENDVFKPWDYHVSAVIPQIDSPACINPVEQLSITQDKTVIFNFPTPLASQRFIYSDAEMDMLCVAGADSSTQGGIIKTSLTKYDLDSAQVSTLDTGFVANSEHTSASGDALNFRMPYDWHNAKQGVAATTAPTAFKDGGDAFDTTSNSTHRTYVGMMSTKPYGNGMRLFLLTRGGPVRPQYSDYTPRDVKDVAANDFVTAGAGT
jgi:hypothetical protein